MAETDLRAELESLRASVAALQREAARPRLDSSPRLRRGLRPFASRGTWLAVTALTLLLATLLPAALLANDRFTDVPSSNPHHDDINLIAAAGVTLGCSSPTTYCPNDPVSRAQMASFIARAAGLGNNPPVADAATLAGYAPGDLVRVGGGVNADVVMIDTNFDDNAYTTTTTVTIAASGTGFVLVSGATFGFSASAACDGSGGEACTLIARLRATDPGGSASPYLTAVVTAAARAQALSPVYVFPVTAGQRTFALEVTTDGGYQGLVGVLNSSITALYVPFGAAPSSTSIADVTEPAERPRSIPSGGR